MTVNGILNFLQFGDKLCFEYSNLFVRVLNSSVLREGKGWKGLRRGSGPPWRIKGVE